MRRTSAWLSLLLCLVNLAVAQERPNIVFIITDDQGYGDLSCTGNPILRTPNLDALHDSSVRLTNYHVSPTCAPTRGALMSGHYTNRAGPWHTIKGRSFLRTSSTTWGEVFSRQGYATGLFGKWHLGDNYPYRPQDRGFTEVVSHGGGGIGQTPDHWDNAYFNDTYLHNGSPRRYEGFCTDIFFAEAIRFMRKQAGEGKPFLAYISTNAPHGPFHCPEEYWRPYAERGLTKEEAIFFGMIANIDENVGRLRDFLATSGLAQNTIIIFTTDNGTATGHRIFNAGMRGSKNSAYDGGHRVPLFIRWPQGGLAAARDVPQLTAHIDILPTLIELCGLPYPEDYTFDGRSIVPLLFNLPLAWPDRVIITDSQRVTDPVMWRQSATMTQRWRLIDGVELYDMEADPSQVNDVAAAHPGVVQELRGAYESWWSRIAPTFAVETRIVIGHALGESVDLTAHDWITDEEGTPWHQAHIRAATTDRGVARTGEWHLDVEQAGRYEVLLSRWPLYLERPLGDSLPAGAPVPGLAAFREQPGVALPIRSASLAAGSIQESQVVSVDDTAARFVIELAQGPLDLSGTFSLGADALPIGAYYARITLLSRQ